MRWHYRRAGFRPDLLFPVKDRVEQSYIRIHPHWHIGYETKLPRGGLRFETQRRPRRRRVSKPENKNKICSVKEKMTDSYDMVFTYRIARRKTKENSGSGSRNPVHLTPYISSASGFNSIRIMIVHTVWQVWDILILKHYYGKFRY